MILNKYAIKIERKRDVLFMKKVMTGILIFLIVNAICVLLLRKSIIDKHVECCPCPEEVQNKY